MVPGLYYCLSDQLVSLSGSMPHYQLFFSEGFSSVFGSCPFSPLELNRFFYFSNCPGLPGLPVVVSVQKELSRGRSPYARCPAFPFAGMDPGNVSIWNCHHFVWPR